MPTLAVEIEQTRPFASAEVEAYLNLQRSADLLRRQVADLFKPFGLSPTGYNVLRILRGARPEGLTCSAVAERLVSHDPDITRLADRLAEARWLTRERLAHDRRAVVLRITDEGLALLARLDDVILALHRRQLSHLGESGLETLIRLLELCRHPPITDNPETP